MRITYLILSLTVLLLISCRWDSRKTYEYIEYNENNKAVKNENILVMDDSTAYIKAYKLFNSSSADKFELLNENGVDISKTINFVTKKEKEKVIIAEVLEQKRNEETASSVDLSNTLKIRVNEDNTDIKSVLNNAQIIGIWKGEKYEEKIILFKKNKKEFLISYFPTLDFEFSESDDEILILNHGNKKYFMLKWLGESTINDYDIDINTSQGIEELFDHQFYYTINGDGNLLYIYSTRILNTFYKTNSID